LGDGDRRETVDQVVIEGPRRTGTGDPSGPWAAGPRSDRFSRPQKEIGRVDEARRRRLVAAENPPAVVGPQEGMAGAVHQGEEEAVAPRPLRTSATSRLPPGARSGPTS